MSKQTGSVTGEVEEVAESVFQGNSEVSLGYSGSEGEETISHKKNVKMMTYVNSKISLTLRVQISLKSVRQDPNLVMT